MFQTISKAKYEGFDCYWHKKWVLSVSHSLLQRENQENIHNTLKIYSGYIIEVNVHFIGKRQIYWFIIPCRFWEVQIKAWSHQLCLWIKHIAVASWFFFLFIQFLLKQIYGLYFYNLIRLCRKKFLLKVLADLDWPSAIIHWKNYSFHIMILCSPNIVAYLCFPLQTIKHPIGGFSHLTYAVKNKFGAWSWASLLFVAGVGSLALLNLVPPDYENKMFQIVLVLTLKALFTSELGDKTKRFYNFKIKGMTLKGFRKISLKAILICQWPCVGQIIEHNYGCISQPIKIFKTSKTFLFLIQLKKNKNKTDFYLQIFH